jgi:hypothetical protein
MPFYRALGPSQALKNGPVFAIFKRVVEEERREICGISF